MRVRTRTEPASSPWDSTPFTTRFMMSCWIWLRSAATSGRPASRVKVGATSCSSLAARDSRSVGSSCSARDGVPQDGGQNGGTPRSRHVVHVTEMKKWDW